MVVDVVEGGPSDGTLQAGDVVVAVDGKSVSLPNDLTDPLAAKAVGDQVKLTVQRRSMAEGESASESVETVSESVVLGAAEDDPQRPVLGVHIQPVAPRVESSVEVEVDSGQVTGPSAGLAWSLAVVDRLTEESLTGDRDVAVTGEILQRGEVGQIGGIAQKVATVKRNGVDVFLYPASTPESEVAEMERIADGEVELVPVATLEEALDYLDPDGSVRASSSV
jgi:PDZ domain-containing protein